MQTCYNKFVMNIKHLTKNAPVPWESPVPLGEAIAAARETAQATGIPVSLITPDGAVLYPVRMRDYGCWICHISSGTVPEQHRLAAHHADRLREMPPQFTLTTFHCRSNLVHWIAPLSWESSRSISVYGALVGGPVRLQDDHSDVEGDVIAPLRRISEVLARAHETSLRRMYSGIPQVSAERIESLGQQLYRVARSLSFPAGFNEDVHSDTPGLHRLYRETRLGVYNREVQHYRHNEGLQKDMPTYPLETENRLLEAIGSGDRTAAQGVLNELLSHVFFTLGADLERIKIRAREIVVLLSRIVISRGADAERVFGYNYRALDELDGLQDLTDVAHWMSRIVRSFTSTVLHIPVAASHTAVLRKVLDYVEQAYRQRTSLIKAARLAEISPAYLSRIFRQEMGQTFSAYVRQVRTKHARELLSTTELPISDIADLCGFSDQSHLTLVFRREIGMTPGEFRKRR